MAGPIYMQIAADLRRRIQVGEFEPETESEDEAKLPTEDELMATYDASRNTVRNAIKTLVTQQLVHTLQGKGTFVTRQPAPLVTTLTTDPETGSGGGEGLVYTAEVEASGRKASASQLQVEVQTAPPHVAAALDLAEGMAVISRHEKRYVDGLAWSLQTSFYPRSLIDRAPRLLDPVSIDEGTVAYLRECGTQQASYRDVIGVRPPDQDEAAFFGLAPDSGVQLIEIFRTAYDQDGTRVRLTITVYRADRNRFVTDVGPVPDAKPSASAGAKA